MTVVKVAASENVLNAAQNAVVIAAKSALKTVATANAAVNAQIGTGTWDEENEPEDIDMIALSISQDLAEF